MVYSIAFADSWHSFPLLTAIRLGRHDLRIARDAARGPSAEPTRGLRDRARAHHGIAAHFFRAARGPGRDRLHHTAAAGPHRRRPHTGRVPIGQRHARLEPRAPPQHVEGAARAGADRAAESASRCANGEPPIAAMKAFLQTTVPAGPPSRHTGTEKWRSSWCGRGRG